MSGARIGVLGLGRVGAMHARNIAQAGGVDEVVMIGRHQAKTEAAVEAVRAALQPNAPRDLAGVFAPLGVGIAKVTASTDGLATVLPALDGIVVATSTETHPELAIAVAEAGVPSLVEKPLALDLETLERTCDRLEATGTPVMIAFHRRYDPAHRALKERVRIGDVGAIRVVIATDHDRLPLSHDYIPRSGGIWRDLLIHDFDIIPWVTGERIVTVTATGGVLDASVHAEHGDVDTAAALLTLESGALVTVTGTRRNDAGQDVRLQVFGSRGSFGAGLSDHTPVTSTEPGEPAPAAPYQQFIDRFESAFRSEADAFLRVVAGADDNVSPPRAGVAALKVALAAAESVRTGRPIVVEEVPA